MLQYHEAGLTTWDMADIYGPAEEFLGQFRKRLAKEKGEDELAKTQALTKFVPSSGPMTRSIVEYYIDKSIKRMNVKSIDVLQFHWWDYNDASYIDALHHLSKLQAEGKIRGLATLIIEYDIDFIKQQNKDFFVFIFKLRYNSFGYLVE